MISKEEINRSHDSNILETTLKCWEYQKRNIAMVRDIVMYLDRTYVVFQKLVPIYEMGICIFREKIIHDPSIGERLRTVILANITNERNGELIDTLLLRGILGMYLELGVGGENVYDKEFEAPFLAMTRDYYREESLQFISQNNCIEYIKKVEIRLSQENERVNNYMAKTTKPKLKQIIENELITLRAKALIDIEYSGFNVMLRDNKLDDIKALYILFCKVPQNLELLRNRLRAYIKTTGEHIILDQERLKESSLIFIQKLLDLKLKYDLIIKISFHNDTRMAKILKESFEEFLNLNNNIAAYLASYIDELMKTMLKDCTDTESEEKLEPIIVIFRHIHDKDIFENFHKNYLAKRLLNGKSGTYDIEKSFIAKLKSECGYQYTAKLEGMFADMKISKDIMDAYRNTQLYRDSSIQLDVNTLTSGFWPSSNYKLCVLPSCIMSSCCDSFTSFYLTKHTGRKLHWQLNLGTADIKASFKMGKRELTVSTYQMCILMLFNDCGSSSLSFQFLRDATNIPEPEFRRHLLSLCTPKFKILNKSSKSKVTKTSIVIHIFMLFLLFSIVVCRVFAMMIHFNSMRCTLLS
jgi:cullin 3